MRKPLVAFKRPENWNSMSDDEQMAFARRIAEQMGFHDAEDEDDA